MKTKTATRQVTRGFALSSAMFLGVLILAPSAHAATVFYDDFEDVSLDGWDVSGTGGSSGVEFANASNWAFAYTSDYPRYSLTQEFAYDQDQILSFDLHPVYATQGRGNYGEVQHAAAGVTVSFENSFNIVLGEVSFAHATAGYTLSTNSYEIPNSADHFEAQMSDWANLALIDPATNIADIVLDFWVDGHRAQIPRGVAATARVRFDNVEISAIPIPAAVWLFGSGLLGLVGLARRKKAA